MLLFNLLSLPYLATANIIFRKVQPVCNFTNPSHSGCLRGQLCTKENTCTAVANYPFNPLAIICRVLPAFERDVSTRPDGRCGRDFGGAICDPTGAYGGCCSKYGFCGVTNAHCRRDLGCQSNCAPGSGPLTSQTQSTSLPLATAATSGTVSQEPVLGLPTGPTNPSATSKPTNDGSCGANFGGTVCTNWPRGSCCSMYGYCGNSTAHCGAGCQSGACLPNGAEQAPNAIPAPPNGNLGSFAVVADSGVPVMHAALLPNGRIAFLDKVENYTKVLLPNGRCAYAAEWLPGSSNVTPLTLVTNPFCSAGTFMADGTLLSIGGNGPLDWIDPTVGDGFAALRYLKRSITDRTLDEQPWIEPGNNLSSKRWYASAQTLGNGQIFVASGSLNGLDPTIATNNNPTYEILSRTGVSSGVSVSLDILVRNQPYYMYPFIHLLRTGDLFIFVSKSSELWSTSIKSGIVVYPDLPGDFRTYPNTGTSVLLPLSSSNHWDPEVIICGGGAYQDLTSPTDPSCGRIAPLAESPKWEMDAMPQGRGMVEGILLPDGTVLFLNGCGQGAQGFGLATNPALQALLYTPKASLGKRWTTLASSTIPRLYHSVALLLLDGTVMVAGSNPVEQPVLTTSSSNPFITEFRIEVYTPPYLSGQNAQNRPTNLQLSDRTLTADGSGFSLSVSVPASAKQLQIALYHGGFVTHSLHMGQRMMFLDTTGWKLGQSAQVIDVSMPPSNNLAPPGPYVIYVLVDGVPSVGQMVMVG